MKSIVQTRSPCGRTHPCPAGVTNDRCEMHTIEMLHVNMNKDKRSAKGRIRCGEVAGPASPRQQRAVFIKARTRKRVGLIQSGNAIGLNQAHVLGTAGGHARRALGSSAGFLSALGVSALRRCSSILHALEVCRRPVKARHRRVQAVLDNSSMRLVAPIFFELAFQLRVWSGNSSSHA